MHVPIVPTYYTRYVTQVLLVSCSRPYISKSKLLSSGVICVLFTISVKFVINVLPTFIFGLIGVLTFCSVKHFVGIHCYSYAVVC